MTDLAARLAELRAYRETLVTTRQAAAGGGSVKRVTAGGRTVEYAEPITLTECSRLLRETDAEIARLEGRRAPGGGIVPVFR